MTPSSMALQELNAGRLPWPHPTADLRSASRQRSEGWPEHPLPANPPRCESRSSAISRAPAGPERAGPGRWYRLRAAPKLSAVGEGGAVELGLGRIVALC